MTAINETILRAILGAVDEGIHAVDVEGRTIFYNQPAARMDGLEVDEVVGRHVLEVFPSLSPETSTLLQVIRTGRPVTDQQQTFTNFKGRRITTVNSTIPIMVGHKLVGALEVSKDITMLKRMADRIVSLQALLSHRHEGIPRPRHSRLYTLDDIVGRSQAMLLLKRSIGKAALTASPVLISGETGTGKELVAQAIHSEGPRSCRPFIAQNCAAVPETLLESMVFGTARGAFTGARDRPGFFELADQGTLYLDELNSMPLGLQAKLLRAVEESAVVRLGEARRRPVDVRLLASVSSDPVANVTQGRLRQDLYYRLNVVSLRLPPLRERKEDIPLLAEHFLAKHGPALGGVPVRLAPEVMSMLLSHDWPGNVRELEHAIEGALNLLDGDELTVEHLPPSLRAPAEPGPAAEPVLPLRQALERLEASLIERALSRHQGNVARTARELDIPRQTLQYRMKALGLNCPSPGR
ncbi:MAG: sigma 54-interacting transcriptional regulator [Bacillota bacterium]